MRRRRFLEGLGLAGATLATDRGFVLPRAAARAAAPHPPLQALLAQVGGSLGVRVTRFEAHRQVATSEVALSAAPKAAKLVMEGAVLSCRPRVVPAPDRPDGYDIEVSFKMVKGRLSNAALAVTVSLAKWSREGYLMLPGAVYAGNRFPSRHMSYPPLLSEPSDIGPHVPPIISDIPRLNNRPGESSMMLGATDMAVPTVAVRVTGGGPDQGFGLLLLAEPSTPLGKTGFAIVETADRSSLTVAVATPSVRPEFRYMVCNSRVPSTDRGADLDVGSRLTIRLRLLAFPCPEVQTLFDRWFETRRDCLGPMRLSHDLPLSAGQRLIEERTSGGPRMDRTGASPTEQAAALSASASGERGAMPFVTGAESPLAATLPALLAGADDARKRSSAALAFQFRGLAPCGLFHAASDGVSWWDEGEGPPPYPPSTGAVTLAAADRRARRRWTHVGRNAEALYLSCKQLLLWERMDPLFRTTDPLRRGIARVADAFVRLWSRHKQLGQYVAADSGDIAVGGSAAGALAPAALILASRILDDETYLRAATAIAESQHSRFVRAGLMMGGAPAALQCADSRSASGLLESFVMLAEATGQGLWFSRAAEVAHQMATWVVGWDAPLPPTSTLGKMGARTTGAVLVSVQDKWALPGFAGLSGDALLRLYRATGRVAYLQLLRETIHNSTGYIVTGDRRPDPDTKPGWVAGRISIGDALGSPGDVPTTTPASAAQAICLLGATEIPGIYVQPDTGFVFAFDHVEARVVERTAVRTKVSVHNPTGSEAEVRLFSELDRDRARPLDLFPLWGARMLILAPGATDQIEFATQSS